MLTVNNGQLIIGIGIIRIGQTLVRQSDIPVTKHLKQKSLATISPNNRVNWPAKLYASTLLKKHLH